MEEYCKAIAEVKLPGKPCASAHTPRNICFYDEETFQDFISSDIDLRDISRHMADFTPSLDVTQALAAISSCLQSGLQTRPNCVGNLFEIGSSSDVIETGRLNEIDCLYVVRSDIVVQQVSSDKGQFMVYVKGSQELKEVKPREVNEELTAAMRETLSEITLPDGWTHGGYGFPDFSGTRCNGQSVTAMICNKDGEHISLNISIAFPLTSQVQEGPDFPSHLRDSCQYVADSMKNIPSQLTRTQISADLHLIGNLIDDTWQPSTALVEAEILESLTPECSVKRALEICDVIASILKKWYREHNVLTDGTPAKRTRLSTEYTRESILAALCSYAEAPICSKADARKGLNEIMAYQHIYLSSPDREKFRETPRSDAAINDAAIKHILLKTALQLKGAFSQTDKQLEQHLVRSVFEDLSQTDSYYTQHAFVPGSMVCKFCFSVHVSHIKETIASDFSRLCSIVVDDAFAKVSLH